MCFTLIQRDMKYVDAFMEMGSDWTVPEGVDDVSEEYVSKLYGMKLSNSVNTSWQQIFYGRNIIKMAE